MTQGIYKYCNKKSKLDGQLYNMHMIDGRLIKRVRLTMVHLTPVDHSKTKTQVRMPYTTFHKAVKDGYYIPEKKDFK